MNLGMGKGEKRRGGLVKYDRKRELLRELAVSQVTSSFLLTKIFCFRYRSLLEIGVLTERFVSDFYLFLQPFPFVTTHHFILLKPPFFLNALSFYQLSSLIYSTLDGPPLFHILFFLFFFFPISILSTCYTAPFHLTCVV